MRKRDKDNYKIMGLLLAAFGAIWLYKKFRSGASKPAPTGAEQRLIDALNRTGKG